MNKLCKVCGETKDQSEFNKYKAAPDGLQYRCRSCHKAYREANVDRAKATRDAYYARHKEEILARKKSYLSNPVAWAAQKERIYRWNADNIDRHREIGRLYKQRSRKDDPIKDRLTTGRARAKSFNAPIEDFSVSDLLEYWEQNGIASDRCFYTGVPLGDNWELDHKYPLSRQGTVGHVVSNLVPSGYYVNRKKKTRTAEEFFLLLNDLTLNGER